MKQFDINRFCRLARWTLGNERSYYVKAFFQYYVIFTAMFLLLSFTAEDIQLLKMGTVIFVIGLAVIVCMGGSYMFISMTGKHDLQRLLLLPASNLEKFLMRYAIWLPLLPIFLVTFLLSDLTQWLVNLTLGDGNPQFICANIQTVFALWGKEITMFVSAKFWMIALLLQSVYMLGANLLRSHKYAWVCVTGFLIVLLFSLANIVGQPSAFFEEHIGQGATWVEALLWVIYSAIVVFNVMMSYRLFCSRELKGKFFVRLRKH